MLLARPFEFGIEIKGRDWTLMLEARRQLNVPTCLDLGDQTLSRFKIEVSELDGRLDSGGPSR
jgi:hypothetical protein